MNEERAMSPKIKPPTGKEEIMKTTVIETIVMSNNHLADLEKIAAALEIKYDTFTACYSEQTNRTIIDYKIYS